MPTVEVHPSDEGGCGHYRMIWPCQAVQAAGLVDCSIMRDGSLDLQYRATAEGLRVCGLETVPGCDVIVLQRPMSRNLADAIPYLQRAGVAVVVELDDDFAHIHPQNLARQNLEPATHPDLNWLHLQRACSMADLVIVTTADLARKYARHGRVVIIPNYLPEEYRAVVPWIAEYDPPRLCWSGSVATHPTDLQPVATAVSTLYREGLVTPYIVGTGIGVGRRLRLAPDEKDDQGYLLRLSPDLQATDWVSLDRYPYAMAQADIGMVPLDRIPFNEAKSWLKGLEFSGAGVPFVATPTAPYRLLREQAGLGILADRPVDWLKHLRRLAASTELRREIGARAREIVLDRYMIAGHADEWAGAWMLARTNRRKAAA